MSIELSLVDAAIWAFVLICAGGLVMSWLHEGIAVNDQRILNALHEERVRQLNVAHAHALLDQFEMGRQFGRREVGA